MAKSVIDSDRFHNEEAAFAYVEAELWPNGPVCPHCNNTDGAKIGRLQGKTTRPGLYKCYAKDCRKPFTVRIGTIFEDSKLPLRLWLQAIHLLCASKKGISTRQLQRMLGCGMKTAWHLGHRIRYAMGPAADAGPLGGSGVTVEADESEIAPSRKTKRKAGHRRSDNPVVFSLVERGGKQRSMIVDHRGVRPLIRKHLDEKSRLVTDMAQHYKHPPVAAHESVDHSKEYVRGDVHTNTLEGFFSIFKRGLIGTYQHIDTKHFDRYLAEFDFRQNTRARLGINDEQRAALAVKGAKGKRLTYETTAESQAAK
jgi:transposase-like protein